MNNPLNLSQWVQPKNSKSTDTTIATGSPDVSNVACVKKILTTMGLRRTSARPVQIFTKSSNPAKISVIFSSGKK